MDAPSPTSKIGIIDFHPSAPQYAEFFKKVPENGKLYLHDTAIPNMRKYVSQLKQLLDRNVTIIASVIHPLSYVCYARSLDLLADEHLYSFTEFQIEIRRNIYAYKILKDYAEKNKTGQVSAFFYDDLPSMPIYLSLDQDESKGHLYYSHFLNAATDNCYYFLLEFNSIQKNPVVESAKSWLKKKIDLNTTVDLSTIPVEPSENLKTVLNHIRENYPLKSIPQQAKQNLFSKKEHEVAIILSGEDELSYKAIGVRLGIKRKTVESHVRSIATKLGVQGRGQTKKMCIMHLRKMKYLETYN